MNQLGVVVVSSIVALAASSVLAKSSLGVTGGKTVSYQCANGAKAIASYYSLSDQSLSFVKLSLNGKKYTLPSLATASGARYSDMLEIEWLTQDSEASLNLDVSNDSGKLIACKPVKK